MKKRVNILVIPIAKQFLLGVYDEDYKLIKSYQQDGKTTDILPKLFKTILDSFTISGLFYVNGPGSFMAIKVSYIFLQTLAIVNSVELKAVDGFCFNNNSPIKALGKKYFFKSNDDKIYTDFLGDSVVEDFVLPDVLDISIFSDENLPQYHLPAVN